MLLERVSRIVGAARSALSGDAGRVLALGIVAGVCALVAAYSSSSAATHARGSQARAGALAAGSVFSPASCDSQLAIRGVVTSRVDAPLAAMVAPTRTVRLPFPLAERPSLLRTGYVFPLARAVVFADTFGAAREGSTWHHGDDLFAPRGTPVLAVADGVTFSVGWQRLGGHRLWLRDPAGNEFYYAHLEGYARGTRDGLRVRAGEVIGFVGNSGDAELTPPHLHFEVHPAALLGLGYDGAVNPTPYLRSWRVVDRRTARSIGATATARALSTVPCVMHPK
jgi:murein DD-endopeptidase MepM/ murein hydrolase activator NlpD